MWWWCDRKIGPEWNDELFKSNRVMFFGGMEHVEELGVMDDTNVDALFVDAYDCDAADVPLSSVSSSSSPGQ